MAPTRRSSDHLLSLVLVLVTGAGLWYAHASAWDLGGRSPILSYDSAQYALAARELAWHGRFGTPFALPVDLAWHGSPPWPISALQPGLLLAEAAIFKLLPARGAVTGSDQRAWLTLVLPFVSYLFLGAGTVLGARHLLARHAGDAPRWIRVGAPAVLGLAVMLDTEAQHFALAGLTELPFTVLFLLVILGLARGASAEIPLRYGLVLGLAGLFRANMLWLAPLCALGSAWIAPPRRRLRVGTLVMLGYVLPLCPWWFYKWSTFGSPAWDLTRFEVWDQVQGRDWFQIFHRSEVPQVPHGLEAARLVAAKSWGNLSKLVLPLLSGPRGLWLGALVSWLLARPRGTPATAPGAAPGSPVADATVATSDSPQTGAPSTRPLAAAAIVVLAGLGLNTVAASVGMPLMRYVFPTRIVAEAAGLLALGALARRLPGASERMRAAACVAAAALAIGWGVWVTLAGQAESRATSLDRGVPASRTLTALSVALGQELAPGETVMSNLGPALAWQTHHPVIHLAYSPADVNACRIRHDFRHIVLVFRSAARAWEEWQEIVERPGTAETRRELGVQRERRFQTADGFTVVWLQLGPLPVQMAGL